MKRTLGRIAYRTGFVLAAGVMALTLAGSLGAQQQQAQHPAAPAQPASRPASKAQNEHEPGDGERVFAANCSRCHTSPDGFSQRISATVVRHMRVRASLSDADEKALLRFFNPQ